MMLHTLLHMQNTPDALLCILQSAKDMRRVLIQQLSDRQYKLVEKSAKSVDIGTAPFTSSTFVTVIIWLKGVKITY